MSSLLSKDMLSKMRALDRQIDFKENRSQIKRYETPELPIKKKDLIQDAVDRTVAEGIKTAKLLDEETARMVDEYQLFVGDRLIAIADALGCCPEEIELWTSPDPVEYEPGLFKTTQIASYKGVQLMRFERIMLNALEVQFIATPIEEEEDGMVQTEEEQVRSLP